MFKYVSILSLAILISGVAALQADPIADQFMAACKAEAEKKGIDTSTESFTENLTEAIINEDKASVSKFCPSAVKKYDK